MSLTTVQGAFFLWVILWFCFVPLRGHVEHASWCFISILWFDISILITGGCWHFTCHLGVCLNLLLVLHLQALSVKEPYQE